MARHTLKTLQQNDHFGTLCIKGLKIFFSVKSQVYLKDTPAQTFFVEFSEIFKNTNF